MRIMCFAIISSRNYHKKTHLIFSQLYAILQKQLKKFTPGFSYSIITLRVPREEFIETFIFSVQKYSKKSYGRIFFATFHIT